MALEKSSAKVYLLVWEELKGLLNDKILCFNHLYEWYDHYYSSYLLKKDVTTQNKHKT